MHARARAHAVHTALGGQSLFLVLSGAYGERDTGHSLTLGQGVSGFQYAGFAVNYMGIAPVCQPASGREIAVAFHKGGSHGRHNAFSRDSICRSRYWLG